MSSTPSPRPVARPVVAAGAVVLRKVAGKRSDDPAVLEVLLVHRPKYDDWSFPKGKVDRGEHVLTAAVREVAEETGLAIRLGQPLDPQEYSVSGGRTKLVHYWVARVLDSDDVSTYVPNREIDAVRWVPVDEARALLTYKYDRATLKQAVKRRKRTTTFIVLRHAHARARSHWRTDDRFRPLLKLGTMQADRLVPLLAAYDATRLITSSSLRCVATVVPYADACGRKVLTEDRLSEEDATVLDVTDLVQELVDAGKRTVICTHRPVLPSVFDTLGVEDPRLEPGEMVVMHLRRGEVIALERHGVR
jgi:8-oxo-dGTP pyrophosphatase MutT (NUDIX family)/phosphohistidine phosphatase SixA